MIATSPTRHRCVCGNVTTGHPHCLRCRTIVDACMLLDLSPTDPSELAIWFENLTVEQLGKVWKAAVCNLAVESGGGLGGLAKALYVVDKRLLGNNRAYTSADRVAARRRRCGNRA